MRGCVYLWVCVWGVGVGVGSSGGRLCVPMGVGVGCMGGESLWEVVYTCGVMEFVCTRGVGVEV